MKLAGPVVLSSASLSMLKPCALSSRCRSRTSVKELGVLPFWSRPGLKVKFSFVLDWDLHGYATQQLVSRILSVYIS